MTKKSVYKARGLKTNEKIRERVRIAGEITDERERERERGREAAENGKKRVFRSSSKIKLKYVRILGMPTVNDTDSTSNEVKTKGQTISRSYAPRICVFVLCIQYAILSCMCLIRRWCKWKHIKKRVE